VLCNGNLVLNDMEILTDPKCCIGFDEGDCSGARALHHGQEDYPVSCHIRIDELSISFHRSPLSPCSTACKFANSMACNETH
jgi:hypothetical protein